MTLTVQTRPVFAQQTEKAWQEWQRESANLLEENAEDTAVISNWENSLKSTSWQRPKPVTSHVLKCDFIVWGGDYIKWEIKSLLGWFKGPGSYKQKFSKSFILFNVLSDVHRQVILRNAYWQQIEHVDKTTTPGDRAVKRYFITNRGPLIASNIQQRGCRFLHHELLNIPWSLGIQYHWCLAFFCCPDSTINAIQGCRPLAEAQIRSRGIWILWDALLCWLSERHLLAYGCLFIIQSRITADFADHWILRCRQKPHYESNMIFCSNSISRIGLASHDQGACVEWQVTLWGKWHGTRLERRISKVTMSFPALIIRDIASNVEDHFYVSKTTSPPSHCWCFIADDWSYFRQTDQDWLRHVLMFFHLAWLITTSGMWGRCPITKR